MNRSDKNQKFSVHNPKTQELVSRHMWLTTQSQELAERKAKAQNTVSSPQVGQSILPVGEIDGFKGVDHSADRNEDNALADLNRYRREIQPNSPDQIIQQGLADRERMETYAEEYRAEYARQFIENARRNGYEVQLNSDYVVISVRPLRPELQRLPTASPQNSGPLPR